MKKVFLVGLLLVSACASKQPVTTTARDLRFGRGILSVSMPNKKMDAQVDTNTGEVTYYTTPEAAFESAVFGYMSLVQQVDTAQHQLQNPVPAKKDEKKKSEKAPKPDGK